MDIAELGIRLDRLERSNCHLRAIVVSLAVILGFTIVAPCGRGGRRRRDVLSPHRRFLLVDDAGQVRADLSIVDGSPRLAMWHPGLREPAVRLATDVNGLSHLVMWQPGAQQASIALRINNPAEGFGIFLSLGDLANGEIHMTTSRDGRQPAAHIFPPGGGTAVWSAP
jgi:hypothetical protein